MDASANQIYLCLQYNLKQSRAAVVKLFTCNFNSHVKELLLWGPNSPLPDQYMVWIWYKPVQSFEFHEDIYFWILNLSKGFMQPPALTHPPSQLWFLGICAVIRERTECRPVALSLQRSMKSHFVLIMVVGLSITDQEKNTHLTSDQGRF